MNERVVIDWKDGQWRESQKAFEMVNWCRNQKLIKDIDFTWNFNIDEKQTIFYFHGNNASISSFFAILFNNDN